MEIHPGWAWKGPCNEGPADSVLPDGVEVTVVEGTELNEIPTCRVSFPLSTAPCGEEPLAKTVETRQSKQSDLNFDPRWIRLQLACIDCCISDPNQRLCLDSCLEGPLEAIEEECKPRKND